MSWDYWIELYVQTHCTARGLSTKTIAAYQATLLQFRGFVRDRLEDRVPGSICARDVLVYLEYLRRERNNGDAAVNRQVAILKNFYQAMVAMGHLESNDNPMSQFPKIKATPKKLPVVLSEEEVQRLLDAPEKDTVLGLRDRALLAVLYGTGIRASECAGLREADVDLQARTIVVTGKGGHMRVVPLNVRVCQALKNYRQARGAFPSDTAFFRSRRHRGMSRGAIYERVRHWSQQARIDKKVSPHRLRHTFATHLVRAGVNLVTIRDLLGHRSLGSTQVYLHVTAQELRRAAEGHPIEELTPLVEELLPEVELPWQHVDPPQGRVG